MLKVLDLFSGIGGFSLGLERTGGFETSAFCEIEPFPQKVLKKHWPDVPIYQDVIELSSDILKADKVSVDVITGGFPCQDLSLAGNLKGISDGTRSGLWSEIARLTSELRPKYIIVENVANLLSGPSERRGGWFGRVLGDLARCGYDAEWENIPASTLGAPHRRERVWIVAYPKQERRSRFLPSVFSLCEEQVRGFNGKSAALDSLRDLRARARGGVGGEPLCVRGDDGLSDWVDRLGACGNAVKPQIPEMIGRAILHRENCK